MRRVLAVAAISSLAFFGAAPAAFAASPSQQQCEAAGGTFSNQNGTKVCVLPVMSDPVGNSPEGGPQQTNDTQQTTTGQGNSGNKPTDNTNCVSGPGNSGRCQA